MKDVVSIVMPVYNRLDLLMATVQSILEQTYSNFELIIIDDGSIEEVLAYLKQIEEINKEINLILNKKSKGANSCRNIGMDAAKGDFIIFLDSDDILAPFCLEKRIKDFNRHKELDFLAYPCLLFNKDPLDNLKIWNPIIEGEILDRFLKHDAPFQTSGPIWKNESLKKSRVRWDEKLVGWQDWKFHIENLVFGLKGRVIGRVDYFWNAPKNNSISRTSHDTKGRICRMQRITEFALKCEPEILNKINASVVWLAIRIKSKDKTIAIKQLKILLKDTSYANDAIWFVYFDSKKIWGSKLFRGFFRKRLLHKLPYLNIIMKDNITCKKPISEQLLSNLIKNLSSFRKFGKTASFIP